MNWSIEESIINGYKKISTAEKVAFISAMLSGFFSHGFIFYNKLSYLDDSTYYFGVGATYSSGRWGLGLIGEIKKWLGLQNFSMSAVNGLITIFLIALMAILVVRMLNISSRVYAALIGAYLVVFPSVASTFAYMFTAPHYYFAALLMVLAVYYVRKTKYGMIPAIIMIAFGMGIYQANIGVATVLFVLVLICDAKRNDFRKNIGNAIYYFISLVLGIVLYFVLNNFFLTITETELGDYQGISGMTTMSLDSILSGVMKGYKIWLHLIRWEIVGVSNTELIRNLYAVCFILFLISGLYYLYFIYKKTDILNMLYTGVLFLMVPLSLGVIYIMTVSAETNLHTIMVYNLVFIPIYPLVLLENINDMNWHGVGKGLLNWIKNFSVITVFMMFLFYFELDNMAYLKANYQQECAISYYTGLISHIKSTENYSDKYPVLFLGTVDGKDISIHMPDEFREIMIQGYHTDMNDFIAYFAHAEFLKIHCGYKYYPPNESDIAKIYASDYVKEMPCYPKDGAIQVIDDIVVVKLSDKYETAVGAE